MRTVKKQSTGAEPPGNILRPGIQAMVTDLKDPAVRARLKASIAALDPEDEAEAIRFIEAVSMFDNEDLDQE
jgi:hypothetical protein